MSYLNLCEQQFLCTKAGTGVLEGWAYTCVRLALQLVHSVSASSNLLIIVKKTL